MFESIQNEDCKMIAAIVAVDNNWGIGYENNLLVSIPEDMKRFKDITTNGTVIMGRKTYDSLPKKPLPNRTHIIISRKYDKPKQLFNKSLVSNMDFIKIWLQQKNVVEDNDGIYVIGGGFIYKELLCYCERIYITKINNKYKADTFFPNLNYLHEWNVSEESEIHTYNDIEYKFITYDRCDYQIISVQTHSENSSINKSDMVITVKCFNGYKTVIFNTDKSGNMTAYIDNWDYLDNKNNMLKFIDKVEAFNKSKDVIS